MLTLYVYLPLSYLSFKSSVLIDRIVNDFLYSAGQLNSSNLAGNQFVNFSVIALTEMPSCFVGAFLIWVLGRRWSHVLCMTLAALPNLAIIAVLASQEDTQQPGSMDTTALAIISRLVAHNLQFQQQLEKRLCVKNFMFQTVVQRWLVCDVGPSH